MEDAAPQIAPASVEEFRERLSAQLDDLPRRLRQCAEHVAANIDRIAVSTVADLATGADVPPSAVMRFCQIMGFSGFSEMQRLFREAYAPGWPDYSTRLKNLREGGAGSPSALLAEFVEAGRLSLEALAKSVDEAALNTAVQVLSRAGTVHLVGLRRAFPVASYLAYVFEKMQVPAMLHDGVGKLDHRFAMRPGDALLAITFAPYSAGTGCARPWPAGRGVDRSGDQPACPYRGRGTDGARGGFRRLPVAVGDDCHGDFAGSCRRLGAGCVKTLPLAVGME